MAPVKFASVAPVQVPSTGVTVRVLLVVGAVVMRSESVAVSAPPVVGMAQLERSKRTNVHLRVPTLGLTLIVVAALLSATKASSE